MTRLSIVVVGIALVLGTPAASTPSWGAPRQLSAGDRALEPQLAMNVHGAGLVVWNQEIGSVCPTEPASLSCTHIVQAAGRQANGTWQAPVEISRPGIGSRPTAAANDEGDAAILWVHDIGRDRVVQATYRGGTAGLWPEPNDLSDAVLEIREHRIALDGAGNAMAAWAERSADALVVRGAVRSAQSGVWGAPSLLSTPGANASAGPALALGELSLGIAAWVEGSSVRASLIYLTRWQPAVTVSRPGTTVLGAPSVAVGRNGDSVVVWPALRGSEAVVVATYFAYRPATWTEPVVLGVLSAPSERPRAVVDAAGNVNVAWVGPRAVEAAFRSYGAGAWSRPVAVSLPSVTPSRVSLAADDSGNVVAAWQVTGGQVQAALRPRSTGTWQRPVGVSTATAGAPSIALAGDGRAVAVWNRISGDRASVESGELDGKGPVLDRLVVPAGPVAVGAPARFSIRATPWAAPLAGVARWTFGDGGVAQGTAVSHRYARAGRFAVTFSQADGRGDVSVGDAAVQVVARVRNLRRPSIAGSLRVGATLTCRRGTWSGSAPIGFAYRWRRDGRPIPGATARNRRVVAHDAGSRIACAVTATNAVGSTRAVSPVVRIAGMGQSSSGS